jgi:hypothetical protein
MKSLAILTVATRHYFDYWEKMIRSAEENYSGEININFHVFTDHHESSRLIKFKSPFLNVVTHRIEELGWPEATLKRYEIILNHQDSYTEDFLLHLDADMLFKSPLIFLANQLDGQNMMNLVRHPGFYRPKRSKKFLFYLKNQRYILRDIKAQILFGGLGSWERDENSQAFVPRNLRKEYFCGATWFGPRVKFLEFCADLESSVQADFVSGKMARWHDESHLNRWAAYNEYIALTPSFCFDPSFPQLRNLNEFIRAVDKDK